ncbi:hypothetical protein, partial [Streptococcus equi]|uniref:hypothetical protein n=2 Tax=Streptococcus equi TaxID=1336 RepID=UPI0008D85E53
MKKKLVMSLIVNLPLLSLICFNEVSANSDYENSPVLGQGYYGYDDYTEAPQIGDQKVIGFRRDWENARDFGVKPIKNNDKEIVVKTSPGSLIRIFKVEEDDKETELVQVQKKSNGDLTNNRYYPIAKWDGKIVFSLESARTQKTNSKEETYVPYNKIASNGDKFRVHITSDGFVLGSEIWIVGESKPQDIIEQEQKKAQKELEEQKKQENLRQQIKKERELTRTPKVRQKIYQWGAFYMKLSYDDKLRIYEL